MTHIDPQLPIERQITDLLDMAAPLRLFPDDDPAKAPLAGIVDQINALRAKQAKTTLEGGNAAQEGADAVIEDKPRRVPTNTLTTTSAAEARAAEALAAQKAKLALIDAEIARAKAKKP